MASENLTIQKVRCQKYNEKDEKYNINTKSTAKLSYLQELRRNREGECGRPVFD